METWLRTQLIDKETRVCFVSILYSTDPDVGSSVASSNIINSLKLEAFTSEIIRIKL